MAKKAKTPAKPKAPSKTPEQKALAAQQKAQQKALTGLYGQQGDTAGNALINKFMQPGTLGRVDTTLEGAPEQLQRQQALLDRAGSSEAEKDALARMQAGLGGYLSLIHISEPTRPCGTSRMPSSA